MAKVDDQVLSVDLTPVLGERKVRKILDHGGLTVGDFLDDIYFSIAHHVGPVAYGRQWALQDAQSNKIFVDLGRTWAARHGRSSDDRTLAEVGIRPGMRLQTIRPNAGTP